MTHPTPDTTSDSSTLFEHADHELRVTETAVYIGDKMYTLAHLTAVNIERDTPNFLVQLVAHIIIAAGMGGIWFAIRATDSLTSADFIAIGAIILISVSGLYKQTRPTYDLTLSFLSGETVIFRSQQQAAVEAAYRELETALLNQR